MNASQRTTDIARGIYLRAAYMALADNDHCAVAAATRIAWNKWVNDFPQRDYDLVCAEQVRLFEKALICDL